MKLRFGNLLPEVWRMAATVSTVVSGFAAFWMYLVNNADRQNLLSLFVPTNALFSI
jgi:hypothetical protein